MMTKEERAEYDKAYRASNREKAIESSRQYRLLNKAKVSAYAKEWYAANNETYYASNRERLRENNLKWRASNREKIAEKNRRYRASNREAIAEKDRRYRASNREAIAEKARQYSAARRKLDPVFKLQRNLRVRLYRAIKRNQKAGSAVRDLGCNGDQLKKHLESLFDKNMTWDNWGTYWHLDHIYPLAAADLEDRIEFLAVNNWRNLQPLEAKDNLSKGDTVTPEAQALFNELKEGNAVAA